MGSVITKLEKEDKTQANWRRICTSKIAPDSDVVHTFEEMHILRGGKGRVCVCPSLIWPDSYSLIVDPNCLLPYLQNTVSCDALVIWNLNRRNLHDDKKPKKTQGTNYVDVLPHVLRGLMTAKLDPQFINFQDCDFSRVSEDLFKDFLYSQLGRLEEVTFERCEEMPVSNNVYEHSDEENPATRKISVQSVQSLKFEDKNEKEDIILDD